MPTDPLITALFIDSFNADLAEFGCAARVAAAAEAHAGSIELHDEEGDFLDFLPAETSPQMAAIAYRLYGRGLNAGARAGEAAAFAKLRRLIGAAANVDR
jgi:hypothetical protein